MIKDAYFKEVTFSDPLYGKVKFIFSDDDVKKNDRNKDKCIVEIICGFVWSGHISKDAAAKYIKDCGETKGEGIHRTIVNILHS